MLRAKQAYAYVITFVVSFLSVVLLIFICSRIGLFGFVPWYFASLFLHPIIDDILLGAKAEYSDGNYFMTPFHALFLGSIILGVVLIVLSLFDLLPAHWYHGDFGIEAYEDPRRG